MSIQKVYQIKNNQLIIDLPEDFKGKERVLVTVDDVIETKNEKLMMLKQALNDPLFLADMKEVNDDFDSIDHEGL